MFFTLKGLVLKDLISFQSHNKLVRWIYLDDIYESVIKVK